MNRPTRRGLLGGAAVLAACTAAVGASSPDATLLAACVAFDDLERRANATFGGWDCDDPREAEAVAERDRLYAAQDVHNKVMLAHRAVTLDGHRARARSLAAWDLELMKAGPGDFGKQMTAAIVRDLLAGSAGT